MHQVSKFYFLPKETKLSLSILVSSPEETPKEKQWLLPAGQPGTLRTQEGLLCFDSYINTMLFFFTKAKKIKTVPTFDLYQAVFSLFAGLALWGKKYPFDGGRAV